MKEKVKTALLAILVMTSLVQTYLLAYSQPEFDPISQDEYVEAEWIGPQKSLINMMIPKEIVIHRGMNNEHTVLHPHFYFYDLIVRRMQERTFRDFREISYTTLDVQKMRDEEQGVEFLFAQPVPSDVLLEMMSIRSESFSSPDGVNRVWITAAADASEVDAYFFTKSAIYVATNHDLVMRDLEQFVGYGEQLDVYTSLQPGEGYIPVGPITVNKVTLAYDTYTAEQLQTSLFSNPGASRNLLEQNGTEIFTDGKRGLQIDRKQQWMRFSDPSSGSIDMRPLERMTGLNKAMQFVNRHGGWQGNYLLEQVVTQPYGATETYIFRQYYAPFPNQTALPIMSSKDGQYGHVEVTVQQGMITNYERSLLAIDSKEVQVTEVELPGGEQLKKLFDRVDDEVYIEEVFVAYYPVLKKDKIELIPTWTAQVGDGEYLFLHE